MVVFWFFLIALVVVVAAVTLVTVGGEDGAALRDAHPDRLDAPLPADRPVARADLEALRLPMTVRGYRMTDVDDVLGRLGAELAERDDRIARLEAALAGARGAAERSGDQAPAAERSTGQAPAPEPGAGAGAVREERSDGVRGQE
ncbi:cell division protein DivIVA [Streptomyces sp. URMC 123]|uniref:cell division protein DivIVA n=1 Tax=Streptomyces sp. URMC 123 TaxID=3423403 RepID=UPI003F193D3B